MTREDNNEPNFDLLDISGVVRRRKWQLVLGLVLGIALGALHFTLTPEMFTAEMEILVGQKSGDLVKGATADAATEGVQAEKDILSTHIKIMTSRKILSAVLEDKKIRELPSLRKVQDEGKSVVEYLQDKLEVEKGGEGMVGDAHVLIATYTDPSPENCAVILQAIYDQYSRYLKQQFLGTSTEAIALLTEHVRENSEAVKSAEVELANALENSKLLWDGDGTRNIHRERFDQMETRLREIASERAQIEARLRIITESLDRAQENSKLSDLESLSLLSEKEVNRLKLLYEVTRGDVASEAFQAEQPIRQQAARAEYDEYLELLMREKKLLEKFSEGHPTVVSVREQIDLLRSFIDEKAASLQAATESERMQPSQMLETYVDLLKNDIAELGIQYEVLSEEMQREMLAAKGLEEVELRVDTVKRDILRKKELFETSQDTLNELSFVRDYAGFNTDVIGSPEPQSNPSWPQLPISGAVGLMLGLMMGVGLALMAELADQTFRDVGDLEQTLGCDVVAHIPRMSGRKLKKAAKRDKTMHKVLCTYHDPRGRSSEMFRVARTSLLMQSRQSGSTVFSMTSAAPGDGKSTITGNLAVSLAQVGKKTVVLDADLRRPTISKLFGVSQTPGVADVIQGDSSLDEVISPTNQENLFVIPAGTLSSTPTEMLESFAFQSLLEKLREQFDFVLLDTPPVLAVPDPLIVGRMSDSLLLAVRISKSSRAPLRTTCKLLAQAGLQPGFAIVNLVESKKDGYSYSNGYGYDSIPYSEQYYSGYEPSSSRANKPLVGSKNSNAETVSIEG